jgi:hypothetical protein
VTPGGATSATPATAQAPPAFDPATCTRDQALAVILDLLDEVELMRALADRMWRSGRAALRAEQELHGYRCAGHVYEIADAYAAGQRAGASDPSSFDLGWESCWQRFAAEIGTRSFPRRWTRDRRQSPSALRKARQAWDAGREERQARIRASWDAAVRP